jgi:toxin ParE1/3/4
VKTKPAILRDQARRDVESAAEFYAANAGEAVAIRFADAAEDAFGAVSRHPASGSPRYGHELGVPGLRSRLVRGYPYIVFYVERDTHVDVWRVLHAQRDLAIWLQQE